MTSEQEELDLTRSVNRLGDTAEQLATVLQKVDENQKALLKLRLDVVEMQDRADIIEIKNHTENQLAKSRNKTAVLVLIIMIIASVFGLLSYTKVRSNANNAIATSAAAYSVSNQCNIDFNTKVLAILKKRNDLHNKDQANLTNLLEKLAIPGTTYEEGQVFRRAYISETLTVRTERDNLVYPKSSC